MRIALFAALSFAVAVPAVAQDAGGQPQPAKPKKEKKVCKTLEATSGSRMPTVICRTPEQWAQGGDNVSRPGTMSGNRDDAH